MRRALRSAVGGRRCGPARASVFLIAALAGGAGLAAGAEEGPTVAKGATPAEVVRTLGNPRGMVRLGPRMVYEYDRGVIEFRDDRVVGVDLVTPQEAAQADRERARIAEERRQRTEADRQQSIEQGRRELAAQQGDEAFGRRPASERLAYWLAFRDRFPYTDVSERIAAARVEAAAAQRAAAQTDELGRLRRRIGEIDARFKQLDADYAASLANWKRTEIETERAALKRECEAAEARIREIEPPAPSKAKTMPY